MSIAIARPKLIAVARAAPLSDRAWLASATIVVLAVCAVPYVLSAVWGPPDLDRLGTFWFNHDFSQYQAAMREGARSSSWLIHDHFSAEPHAAILMYPLYVAAGKLAALLHVSDLAVFATMEWLGRMAVVCAVYWFAATFSEDRRARRLALLLAVGTLGLDVFAVAMRALLEVLRADAVAAALPTEINPYLEVSSFGVLLSAPHLMFGLALTLASAPLYLRAIHGRRLALALLGTAVAALSLVHTFNTPVLASVLAIHALRIGRGAWPAALVAIAAATPMAIYSAIVFGQDPFWSATYGAQNLMPSPAPWMLPFDFGLVLIAAPFAWPVVKRWRSEQRWFMLAWIGLGLVWMYAPVPFQRRLSFGVQPALAVLAAVGLLHVNACLRERRTQAVWRRVLNYAAAVAAISTSLLVYVSLLASALFNRPTEVYLWTRAESESAAWLAEHSIADDVVLASTAFANPLAGAIDGRVVQGHNVATSDNRRKEREVWAFFAADTPSVEREQLLRAFGATIVALGPHERAVGAASLTDLPELHRVYDRDGVELYRVKP